MSTSYFRRKDCRLCHSTDIQLVFALQATPLANEFVPASEKNKPQEKFPLDLFFCNTCAHLQLCDVVNPDVVFRNYVYVSGTSPVFIKHFQDYAEDMISRFALPRDASVVEMGSNDGTLLRFFANKGLKVLGIDPARSIAKTATESGIETLPEFFSEKLGRELAQKRGKADLFIGNNVFAHIDDLDDIVRGVKALLKKEGVFVFEVSYLVDVFEKTLFDTIYHEHLSYHSIKPLKTFFERLGMQLIHVQSVSSHGGSIRVMAKLKDGSHPVHASVGEFIAKEEKLGLDRAETFKAFAQNIERLKNSLNAVLVDLKKSGKTIAGFGAPAKATTLMHHFGIGPDFIDYIVDDSPLKQDLFSPGLHIPVVSSAQLSRQRPDYLVVLAWNFADSIIEKNKSYANSGGHFIVPLPNLRVV